MNDLHYHKSDIQANILKGHGRQFACFVFFTFLENTSPSVSRKAMAKLANEVTSFEKQGSLKNSGTNDAEDVIGLYFSNSGFSKMKINPPQDPYFQAGMDNQHRALEAGDYFQRQLEQKITRSHGLILIANACFEKVNERVAHIKRDYLLSICEEVYCIDSQSLRAPPREHFGYADGFSTPRKEEELAGMGLVKEAGDYSYGSYVAFRKIEQCVTHFNTMVCYLMRRLGKSREYAMALLMGRFPNGTPLTLFDTSQPKEKWENTPFDYTNDDGGKCPLHAHIRVVNPREKDNSGSIITTPRIIRRSMTYEGKEEQNGTIKKGLCFLSYQNSIEHNFIPLMKRMGVKTEDKPKDAITYQPDLEISNIDCDKYTKSSYCGTYAKEYGNLKSGTIKQLIGGSSLTTFKGGQYFFAPSIPFLRDLENLGADEHPGG